MRRCEVLECGKIVNEKGQQKRQLRDKFFCSQTCAAYWLAGQGIRIVSDRDKPKLPVVVIRINS